MPMASGGAPHRAKGRRMSPLAGGMWCLALSLASLAPVAMIATRPADPGAVAALFPPWWPSARILSAAGTAGRLAAVGRWPAIVVVRGDASVLARLKSSGAVLLFDPRAAVGCDILSKS